MEKLTFYNVVLDGIDKTGKDTICRYVFELSKKRYLCTARGLMSLIAYSKLFNRKYTYDFEKEKDGPTVNFLLEVDKDDWKIRCALTNEPEIDYDEHVKAFENAAEDMCAHGILVRKVETSHKSPYDIAMKIVEYMNFLNEVEQ